MFEAVLWCAERVLSAAAPDPIVTLLRIRELFGMALLPMYF
jgi:hypothetical protein